MARFRAAALIVLALIAVRHARAAGSWTGGGADDNWTTPGNWNAQQQAPPPSGNTQKLTFQGNTRRTPNQNLGSPYVVNELTFSAGAGDFTLGGQQIQFAGASPILRNDSNNIQLLDLPIDLASSLQVLGNSMLLRKVISGAGGIEIAMNASSLRMDGNAKNTYTGSTLVESGTLTLNKNVGAGDNTAVPGDLTIGAGNGAASVMTFRSHQIADSATVTVNANATLDFEGTTNIEKIKSLKGAGTVSLCELFGLTPCTLILEEGDFSGSIDSEDGVLELNGGANSVLKLSGTSDFVGIVRIKQGTMDVTGSLGTQNNRLKDLIIGTDGALKGTGTAFLAPGQKVKGMARCKLKVVGNSPAVLTIDGGGVDLDPGAIVEMEIDGTAAGNGSGFHSQLVVVGEVGIDQAEMHLVLDSPPTLGARYPIIANDGVDAVIGRFAGLPQNAVIAAFYAGVPYYFRINYAGSALALGGGGGGNDVVLTSVTAPHVPGEASQLRLTRLTDSEPSPTLRLDWDASCSPDVVDYAIYEGVLGSWYSHTSIRCTDVASDRSETFFASSGGRYYLVVPREPVGGTREGSYGRASSGAERPRGAPACVTAQQLGLLCP